MKRHRAGAMAWTLLAAGLFACAERELGETANPIDAGVDRGAAGGAGSGGAAPIDVSSRAGAGSSGLERCSSFGAAGAPSSDAATQQTSPTDADAAPPAPLGLSGLSDYQETTREGRVTRVLADRMEIETPTGSSIFGWRGPSLAASFDVGEAVQVVIRFVDQPKWSIIRSERATAATVVGGAFASLSKQPGSTSTLQGPQPGFPELIYGFVSCCSLGAPFNRTEHFKCDYSQLEGDSGAIAPGATGSIGPWSVTNVDSTFYEQFESWWSVKATLLGPATQRSPDAGI